jgi:polyferredoxin
MTLTAEQVKKRNAQRAFSYVAWTLIGGVLLLLVGTAMLQGSVPLLGSILMGIGGMFVSIATIAFGVTAGIRLARTL